MKGGIAYGRQNSDRKIFFPGRSVLVKGQLKSSAIIVLKKAVPKLMIKVFKTAVRVEELVKRSMRDIFSLPKIIFPIKVPKGYKHKTKRNKREIPRINIC